MLNVKNSPVYSLSRYFTNLFSWVTPKEEQPVLDDQIAQPYQNDTWVLSKKDSQVILNAMENPPAPSEALLSLFE
jgi:hypothetical protein